ncbi:alpha-1,4-N-acetylglucosaminyltransferase-like [Leptodactylus fuscus]|uniref:alpha-1,4-N-acetylglucosaminyltransferase-like n=1 Tax=Leptodactylus fuscus TaxID=238119 RepID=UPI003F4EF626
MTIKEFRIFQFILLLIVSGILYKIIYQRSNDSYFLYIFRKGPGQNSLSHNLPVSQEKNAHTSQNAKEHRKSNGKRPEDILNHEDGIIFLETTDTMQPQALVLCAIESAARVYHDRPVAFFMKGLSQVDSEDKAKTRNYFPTLSSLDNIYIFPLIMEEVFNNTPFFAWYKQINPKQEKYWIHIIADSCRLALIWKYGGMYMDTDIISIQSVPYENFVAAQNHDTFSNGVFGFSSQHNFTWKCMENFVKNYNGDIWGFQGPFLFTRVLKESCGFEKLEGPEDTNCGNISVLNPQRFYAIGYGGWEKFYTVWDNFPTFSQSYAIHLWNYMNFVQQKTMVPGSNTLVEHLYKKYCPFTYGAIERNESLYL